MGKALFCCYCCINYLLNCFKVDIRYTVINLFQPLPLPSTYPQRNFSIFFYVHPIVYAYFFSPLLYCLLGVTLSYQNSPVPLLIVGLFALPYENMHMPKLQSLGLIFDSFKKRKEKVTQPVTSGLV